MSIESTEAQRKLAEFAESNPHLSYKELAEKLECSQQTVSRACLKFGVRRKRVPLTEADLAKLTETDTTRPLTKDEKAAVAAEANDDK